MTDRANILTGAAALFLGGHLIAAYLDPGPVWGVDFLAHVGTLPTFAFVILSLSLFALSLYAHRIRVPWNPWASFWTELATSICLGVVGLLLFVSFSSRVHLLGDGLLYLRELSETLSLPEYPRMDRAPLSFWLLHRMGVGLASLGVSAEMTFRSFSYASGFLYIVGAIRLAAVLAERTTSRYLILFGLLTSSYIQLYFGYIETYPLVTTGILLYCLLAFASLRGTTT